jgi:ATP-binding cassette subfamily B protein
VQELNSLQKFVEDNGEFQQFNTGQLIFDRNKDPNNLYLIVEGEARLIFKNFNKRSTLSKIGPGYFIGLASLATGINCEEVRSSSKLSTIKISRNKILDFIENDFKFKKFINTNLFQEEVAYLIETILPEAPIKGISLKIIFDDLYNKSRLLNSNSEIEKAIKKNEPVFVIMKDCDQSKISKIDSINIFYKFKRENKKNNLRFIGFLEKSFLAYEKYFNIGEFGQTNNLENDSFENFKNDIPEYDVPSLKRTKEDLIDINLESFRLLSDILNIPFRKDSIEIVLKDAYRSSDKPGIQFIGKIATSLGLHAVAAKVPSIHLNRIQSPSFVWNGNVFSLIKSSDENSINLFNEKGELVKIKKDNFEEIFSSDVDVVLIEKSNLTKTKRFGLDWFLPILKKYKKVLFQVLVASFVIQLFTLSSPLIIQLIIDKVINQRSLDTLQVLGVALILVTFLEAILGSLKTFLFTDTTNRIDQRLGSEVIDHLLRLPLNYFDKRPVGELASRISELEKIRNFITGQAMNSILDALFSLIYILVMFFYSTLLTIVALAVIPIQIILTLIGAPLFRRQYRRTAEENAKTQSHLVEVLSGVQTVKAQNAEVVSRWKWQDYYSKYISRTFEQTITGTVIQQFSQVLQKISQLLVLWVGAQLVLDGYLSLGQLIAFRIISGYVTQPVLRLSSIWQNIQELKISFERLSDVIDTPQESDETDKEKIPLSEIKGDVRFEEISFGFSKTGPKIINELNLNITNGQFVGIVGESGSGKSTLMKLLPRLYSPDKGRILIDNTDIDKVELYSLRRQIGVVPQDPLLFSGTISHNISLNNPNASAEEIVNAAKIADAHEFIMKLPDGYSSSIGERATTLSGGQRQRIAIARTILGNPKLLIMDEATSALDYKTEKNVCENLSKSLNKQTVFFITHRLATIKDADLIVLMDKGNIAEIGNHDFLINKKGKYFDLYTQQEN